MNRELFLQSSAPYSPLTAFLILRRLTSDKIPYPEQQLRHIDGELGATGLFAHAWYQAILKDLVVYSLVKVDQAPDTVLYNQATEKIVRKLEVTHYTGYSHQEGLVPFLKRTKLNPAYAYPDETVILCHWLGVMTEPVNWQTIHDALLPHCKNNPLYIIVRTDPVSLQYQTAQILPNLEVKNLNLLPHTH